MPNQEKSRVNAMQALCVALDVADSASAIKLAEMLRDHVGWFKVGLELFTSEGPVVVHKLVERGARVFLDLKFHDIPNTVAGAARSATRLGVSMFNVHAAGGEDMLRAAIDGATDGSGRRPTVVAVTVLTSIDQHALEAVGFASVSVETQVLRLARLAGDAGLDGVVASPHEISAIRRAMGAAFNIVVPGIRPVGSSIGDQKRIATPRLAISQGANMIVVGRPITAAADPVASANAIVEEILGE